MNSREALRLADPARHLPPAELEPRDEALLREILEPDDMRQHALTGTVPTGSPRRALVLDWRAVFATGVVAIAVIAASIVAIRAVPPQSSGTAASRSSSPPMSIDTALNARLIQAAGTRATDTNLPALMWTQNGPASTGGAIDLTGKTPVIAAACTDGGTIAIQTSGRPDVNLDCTKLSAIGPINLAGDATSLVDSLDITVVATSGHPRFIAKLIAVTPDPANAQTCEPNDLAGAASPMEGAAGTDHGTITLTNTGTDTCTIHGQPTASLTNKAGGRRIGAASGTETTTRGQLIATVVLPPGEKATITVSIVNISGYKKSDGTYYPTCGRPITGTGWTLAWTGTKHTKYIPFASGTRQLCSNTTTRTSNIGPLIGPLVGQEAR